MIIDYLKIMFMLHMKILYEMINYVQKFRYARWNEKMINLIILIKNDETQQWSEYKLLFNKSIIMKFVLLNKYW